jgi:hypothetical protein
VTYLRTNEVSQPALTLPGARERAALAPGAPFGAS